MKNVTYNNRPDSRPLSEPTKKRFLSRHRLSVAAIIFVAVTYLFSMHAFDKWRHGILGGGDTWGYYFYLPATFIHDDLDNLKTSVETRLHYLPGTLVFNNNPNPLGVQETHVGPIGKQVNKYTVGLAILYSPFFFMAHFLAKLFGLPADGYSPVYMYLMHLSSIFFTVLGLTFLRKVLLRYFSDVVCAITLLLVAIGTNLFYFTAYNSVMAHSYLFCLYCVLIYATIKWYDNPNWKAALGIGLSVGFITLIRPTEIICLAIPVFWGLSSFSDVRLRVQTFARNYKSLLFAALVFVAVGIPQLLYWKAMTGHFLYYSYGEETFDFKNPEIIKGLFGFRNGWLAYTPLMYLAVFGIFGLIKARAKEAFWSILLLLPVHIYIIYSWWCWYYINGFGSRPMVETYALLSIPFAVSVAFILRKRLLTFLIIPIVGFLVWLNIFNTYQFSKGVLWSEMGNWAYYKGILGKTKLEYADLVRFDLGDYQPIEDELIKRKVLFQTGFEDSVSADFSRHNPEKGFVFTLTKEKQFSPGLSGTLGGLGLKPGDWVRVSVDFLNKEQWYNLYGMNTLVTEIKRGDENLQWKGIRLDNKQGSPEYSLWGGPTGTWGTADYWMRIPAKANASDNFTCYVWSNGAPEIILDNLTVELWQEK